MTIDYLGLPAPRDGVTVHQKLLWSILFLQIWIKKKGSFIIFRLFNVYGKRLQGRVVDGFIGNALKNKDLKIYGTGKQTRAFFHRRLYEIFWIFRKEI